MPASVNRASELRTASPTLVMNERMRDMESSGYEVYKFGFGQSPFPVLRFMVDSLKRHAHQKDYLPVQGYLPLRQAIVNYYNKDKELYSPDQLIIGPGSKELIWSVIFSFDGEIILPQPSWVSYAPQAELANKKIHWLPTSLNDNWIIDPEVLAKIAGSSDHPKLIILNYPNNPSGTGANIVQMKAIAEVCRQHNIIVLHDEIYGRLSFDKPHVSFAEIAPELTIRCNGISKWAGAGGWRLGFQIFPSQLAALKQRVLYMASETYSCVSTPIQMASVEAFTELEKMDDYISNCRSILYKIGNWVCDLLNKNNVHCQRPQGGFYIFPDFNNYNKVFQKLGVTTSDQFCELLLNETGVALLPGSVFGMDKENLVARLAYVDFDGEKLLNIIENKPELFHANDSIVSLFPKVGNGINKLIQWLKLKSFH